MGRLLLGVYAISITTTLSALYEISEYIGDAVYPTNRVTGLFDTSDDLLWNFLAAVLVVWFGLWLRRRKKSPRKAGLVNEPELSGVIEKGKREEEGER